MDAVAQIQNLTTRIGRLDAQRLSAEAQAQRYRGELQALGWDGVQPAEEFVRGLEEKVRTAEAETEQKVQAALAAVAALETEVART
jgi:hypothetical protein